MNYPQLINNLKQELAKTEQSIDSVSQQIIDNEDKLEGLGFFGDAPDTEEMEDFIGNAIETQQEHLMKKNEKLTTIASAQRALLQAYNLLKQYYPN